jgi:hypothetical protein
VELRTYTDLWRMDRRIYAIQDLRLPVPVGMTQLAAAAIAALIWLPVAFGLGLTSLVAGAGEYATGLSAILLAGPPIAIGWATGRPLIEGRTLGQHLAAAARYRVLPPHLVRLEVPDEQPDRQTVHAAVWIPTHKDPRA